MRIQAFILLAAVALFAMPALSTSFCENCYEGTVFDGTNSENATQQAQCCRDGTQLCADLAETLFLEDSNINGCVIQFDSQGNESCGEKIYDCRDETGSTSSDPFNQDGGGSGDECDGWGGCPAQCNDCWGGF